MLYDVLYEGATLTQPRMICECVATTRLGQLAPSQHGLEQVLVDEWNDYWDERYHLQDVLDNYNGSVYIVWGMQDWNVDPYHAFLPTNCFINRESTFEQLQVSGRTITPTSRMTFRSYEWIWGRGLS